MAFECWRCLERCPSASQSKAHFDCFEECLTTSGTGSSGLGSEAPAPIMGTPQSACQVPTWCMCSSGAPSFSTQQAGERRGGYHAANASNAQHSRATGGGASSLVAQLFGQLSKPSSLSRQVKILKDTSENTQGHSPSRQVLYCSLLSAEMRKSESCC